MDAPRPTSHRCAARTRPVGPVRPVGAAAPPDDPVRDDGRGADLRALGREFPPQLAERPARRGADRRARARCGAGRAPVGGARGAAPRRRRRQGDRRARRRHAPPARAGETCRRGRARPSTCATASWHDADRATPSTRCSRPADGADPGHRHMAWGSISSRSSSISGRCATAMLEFSRNILRPVAAHLGHHGEPRLPRPAMGDRAAGAAALGQHRRLRGRSGGRLARDPRRRDRDDEIGVAEQALARMEAALADELRQKRRLAELGLAVSKINHELRNMLTTAQLLTDRLERRRRRGRAAGRAAARRARSAGRSTSARRPSPTAAPRERLPQRRLVPLAPLVDELRRPDRPRAGRRHRLRGERAGRSRRSTPIRSSSRASSSTSCATPSRR